MRLLLDTHIAAWATFKPGLLSRGELDHLSREDVDPVLSAVSIWELRVKWHSYDAHGRRKGPVDPARVLEVAVSSGWELLEITHSHALATLHQKLGHKDPFDELLLIQAQEEGMRLLTRDRQLLRHPLALTAAA